MNLQEAVEKAFKAGANFSITHTCVLEGNDFAEFPTEEEIDQGIIEYLNKIELFTEIK